MMSGDTMYGICQVCGKKGALERTYFRYQTMPCECHNGRHSYLVDHHPECKPREALYQNVSLSKETLKNPVPLAVDILKKASVDKEPGSYYDSWVSNIACCIMDQFSGVPDAHEKAFLDLLYK